jgi:hypothetical protein
MAVDYHLVSAARRLHRLRTDRTYVFGRDEGCDIVIQDALISRRHADMRWTGSFWEIKDLGSKNGVQVNRRKISMPTRVNDGDQLQVGGQVYRLHLLPPGADPSSLSDQAPKIADAETFGPDVKMQDIVTQGANFHGEVTKDGLLDLLQFFNVTTKTGRLDLVGGRNIGAVWFTDGQPTHALHGAKSGLDALLTLAQAPPPRFAFHAAAPPPGERSVQGSMQGILMEISRLLDEANRKP